MIVDQMQTEGVGGDSLRQASIYWSDSSPRSFMLQITELSCGLEVHLHLSSLF